ncbi:MAG: cytochrome C assembly family protein, partial [Gammaproteobacteria bacterium]
SLPPLQTMESLLFQMLATGLFFLTISLVSGFVFIEDVFAQHLAHKTVLSILAWLIFSALLIGRSRYGWRGQIAIQWTLIGFVSLLLAYFGSKLVLEIILKR